MAFWPGGIASLLVALASGVALHGRRRCVRRCVQPRFGRRQSGSVPCGGDARSCRRGDCLPRFPAMAVTALIWLSQRQRGWSPASLCQLAGPLVTNGLLQRRERHVPAQRVGARRVAERHPQAPLAREGVGIGISPPSGERRSQAQRCPHPGQHPLRHRQERRPPRHHA
jgi:hypothetical protein